MYKLIATCFGIGYIKKGGGTVASLFCCIVLYLLGHYVTMPSTVVLVAVTLLLLVVGTISATKVEPLWGKDSYRVVIDEVAGMWISVLFLPYDLKTLVVGLALFRFFDILKPLYIRRAEALSGGIGVMMDDVLAGIYANVLLQLSFLYHLL